MKAASEPGVTMGGQTELPRPASSERAVYLRHSGEAELGAGLFIFHTFPPSPFQRVLRNPNDRSKYISLPCKSSLEVSSLGWLLQALLSTIPRVGPRLHGPV